MQRIRSARVQTVAVDDSQASRGCFADEIGIAECLLSLVDCEEDHDVEFLIGSPPILFYAHRCILRTRSKFFLQLFQRASTQKMKLLGPFAIPSIPPEIFLILLHYLYTDIVDLTKENVKKTYEAAELLTLSNLTKVCDNFMTENDVSHDVSTHQNGSQYKNLVLPTRDDSYEKLQYQKNAEQSLYKRNQKLSKFFGRRTESIPPLFIPSQNRLMSIDKSNFKIEDFPQNIYRDAKIKKVQSLSNIRTQAQTNNLPYEEEKTKNMNADSEGVHRAWQPYTRTKTPITTESNSYDDSMKKKKSSIKITFENPTDWSLGYSED